jgi:hypothetical protein
LSVLLPLESQKLINNSQTRLNPASVGGSMGFWGGFVFLHPHTFTWGLGGVFYGSFLWGFGNVFLLIFGSYFIGFNVFS